MNTAQLIQYTSLKLGEQNAFYPSEEIVVSGLNPAQRLLCLAHPRVLVQRLVFTVGTEQPFIDLRRIQDSSGNVVGNHIRTIQRVLLGDVTTDPATSSTTTGELSRLRSSTLAALVAQKNWLRQRGEIRRYWQWGKVWFGVYKRPVVDTTITLIYEAIPTVLSINDLTASPSVQDVYHTTIAEVAAGLLLVKEGAPQGQRGLQMVVQALQITQTPEAAA